MRFLILKSTEIVPLSDFIWPQMRVLFLDLSVILEIEFSLKMPLQLRVINFVKKHIELLGEIGEFGVAGF